MYKLITLTGFLAFIFLILTAMAGFMMYKLHVKWVKVRLHIVLSLITVIFALLHVGLVFLAD